MNFVNKRLEDIKQKVLLSRFADINLENDFDLYSYIINDFANGELDDIYKSPFLNLLDYSEREELLKVARSYISLCFVDGFVDNWVEVSEISYSFDLDTSLIRLFDNFDILLELLKYGGKKVLDQLVRFQSLDIYSGKSVIDHLRYKFPNNVILKQALIELSQDDNRFCGFSDLYKALLCEYSLGNLYILQDSEPIMISPVVLGKKIMNTLISDSKDYSFDYSRFLELISDYSSFYRAISCNYLKEINLVV